MAGSRRLEPTVFLAMISPITVGFVAASVAVVLALGGPWWLTIGAAVGVWALRVLVAGRVARRLKALPRRIDPFALREPWRLYVRDAVRARRRFLDAVESLDTGPLRSRLGEIGERVSRGVEECWAVAQRGQKLSDARRAIDPARLRRALESADYDSDDPRRSSAESRLAAHDRLAALETDTRTRLEILDARLDESVVQAIELSSRSESVDEIDSLADDVDGIVGDLEALRYGLDTAEGSTS
ncbi:MAG: hypothetical protein ACE5GB_03610 [Acidimicrobiales bacterium]